MSIDLTPYGSFALDPAPPVAPHGQGQTLTLELRLRRAPDAMSGTVSTRKSPSAAPNVQRAAVVAVDPAPLTITFEP
jgi:hypothetical protein